MKESDRAWLAGLFEGEGCASINKERSAVRVSIKMTDRDVMEHVHELFPSSTPLRIQEPRWEPNRKTQYVWTLRRGDQVREFLALISPWLFERRSARVAEAIEVLDNRPGGAGAKQRAKTHCPRGHAYAGENLYVRRGRRHCKTCMRDGSRERMIRVRAAADAAGYDGSEPWHGTSNGYSNHACRCGSCRQANSDYNRAYRQRRKALAASPS